ncbi:MAG: ABC transporter permease [Candidatus Bathyarchaeota archaeon]|nr:ABC transporter permease [Candidatus Bathyarchaeota archaeon]
MKERNERFELKGYSTYLWLKIILENFRNAIFGWTFFAINFLMSTVGMLFNSLIFFVMAEYVGPSASPMLAQYGGDYASYIILGIVFNTFLSVSLDSYYQAYSNGYWGSGFEIYATSPIGISAFILGSVLFSYFVSSIQIAMYMAIGIFAFHIDLASANYLTAIIVLLLSTVAVSSIGLIAASTFTLLNCKGWGNPVTWIVSLLVGLISGVYFPPEMLPAFVQNLSACLPQTYAYEAARLAMLAGADLTHTVVYRDLSIIILQMLALLPIGIILYKMSLRKAEKEGALTRWS